MANQPLEQTHINARAVPFNLSAGVPQLLLAGGKRNYLFVQNTGVGSLTIGLGAAPSAAGHGISLDPAAAAGGQGGSYEAVNAVPGNAVWALAGADTTCIAIEG